MAWTHQGEESEDYSGRATGTAEGCHARLGTDGRGLHG